MHPVVTNSRTWATQLVLSSACAMLLTTSAYAQFPGSGFSFPPFTPPSAPPSAPAAQPATSQTPQPVGTVLTVPLWDFGTIAAQNAIHGKNVNLLQVSQTAVGDMNSQVATVSIRQHNGTDFTTWVPSTTCFLPTGSLSWVQQANKDSTIIEQNVIGFGNTQVAQVQVDQANQATVPPGTKFMMCPLSVAPAIQALNQKNVNIVHISQLAVGNSNSQVALLAVNQQNAANLQVPAQAVTPLVQLNLNLNIITQVAVGNGNTQVATVDVGQSNNVTTPGP
jgi:predicted amino acid-binding ACT domain protein